MHHNQIISESNNTRRLLDNLNLAIDEATLVRKIISLSDQLRKIENTPDQAQNAQFIQKEIDHFEDKLGILHFMSESADLISNLSENS